MTQDHAPPPDLRQMARDWITIWQSELNAAASDREMLEGFARLVDRWAEAAQAAAEFLPGAAVQAARDGTAGRARTGPSARAAATPAAPDARDLAIERLADRVAELERILARVAAREP